MTFEEFANKIEREGGVAAAIEYGLSLSDLEVEVDGTAIRAWEKAIEGIDACEWLEGYFCNATV